MGIQSWRGYDVSVYLDTSVYNRPFDDQTQPRIWLETLAFVVIVQMIEAGEIELVSSLVLEYENSRNPFPLRKRWVDRCLALASSRQRVNEGIRKRAQELEEQKLGAMDALHLACAETAASECFLTCDQRMMRRYQGLVQVPSPVDFVLRTAGEPR